MALEDFERCNLGALTQVPPKPKLRPWYTPDSRPWTSEHVLVGHKPRLSDAWAHTQIDDWLRAGRLTVHHVELPFPLIRKQPDDAAWKFIAHQFGPVTSDFPSPLSGHADLASLEGSTSLLIYFGSQAPARFVLNLMPGTADLMIVPYDRPYAFVFSPNEQSLNLLPDLLSKLP